MKILVSQLPAKPWWGNGIAAYDDNWGMQDGVVPNQTLIEQEHQQLINTLRKYNEVELVPFPDSQQYPEINHDFVFVRDQFISGKNHSIVICNLRRPERKQETDYIKAYFDSQGVRYQSLSQAAIADGGEFHYLPKENILFAGISRNSKQGIDEMARYLGTSEVIIVETNAYHLDTVFSVLLDKHKNLAGILTSYSMLKHSHKLKTWAKQHNIPVIDLDPSDTMGPKDKQGTQASNALALPAVLISNAPYQTPGAEEQIRTLGINHVITPTSQFNLSGGSVHCLTNEL